MSCSGCDGKDLEELVKRSRAARNKERQTPKKEENDDLSKLRP